MRTPELHLAKVMVIDDDDDVHFSLRIFLEGVIGEIVNVHDPQLAMKQVESVDIVLLDMNYSQGSSDGEEGFKLLKRINRKHPEKVVVCMTSYGNVEMSVRALREGALDFILKPLKREKVVASISSAMTLHRSLEENRQLRQQNQTLSMDRTEGPFILGKNPRMQKIYMDIEKVAKTDANVLILGENGTGKAMIAREIHRQSARHDEVMLECDLGTLSETVFESELFGHTKGAFTGARDHHVGRFELASKGSLFLDEVSNLSMKLQSKLLQAIQEKVITRVGSNTPIPFNTRMIFASNQPIYKLVEEGSFRQDLLFRINTVEILLPPLRERPMDIETYSEHFLKRFARQYQKNDLTMSKDCQKHLMTHAWPGNIRELEHAIERAVILCEGDELTPADFSLDNQTAPKSFFEEEDLNLGRLEARAIKKAVEVCDGNLNQAAKLLGLSRFALYRRLDKQQETRSDE